VNTATEAADQLRRLGALMKAFRSNDASSLEVCNFARDIEFDILAAAIECCPSPCGHSSQYAYSEDGGKNIVCLLCERDAPRTKRDAAGFPMPAPTVLERLAIEALNEVKAWRDSDGNEGFPASTRDKVDAVLMTYEQRRDVAFATALKLDEERVGRIAGAYFGDPRHVKLCIGAINKALREAHLLVAPPEAKRG
jgi:hypothetical protein